MGYCVITICTRFECIFFSFPRWQYFGSSVGIHRTFPGREWPRNFIGFHEDFDPRTRPWYISATSGPKNVIVIMDGSKSMAEGNK